MAGTRARAVTAMRGGIVFALSRLTRANISPAGLTPQGFVWRGVQNDVCTVKNTLRAGWVQ